MSNNGKNINNNGRGGNADKRDLLTVIGNSQKTYIKRWIDRECRRHRWRRRLGKWRELKWNGIRIKECL